MTTKELGDLGEKLACGYLVKNGYKILGRNYRISFGEIDIVAKKDATIHFVEVKTLQSFHPEERGDEGYFPEQHVDYRKQRKLAHMSQIWLEKNKYPQDIPYQIDIAGVLVNESTRLAKLHYFPNAVGG